MPSINEKASRARRCHRHQHKRCHRHHHHHKHRQFSLIQKGLGIVYRYNFESWLEIIGKKGNRLAKSDENDDTSIHVIITVLDLAHDDMIAVITVIAVDKEVHQDIVIAILR